MTDIGPGTPLICIIPDERFGLAKDALYFCHSISFTKENGYCVVCGKGHKDYIMVKDKLLYIYCNGFCPSRFRPLNDGDTSLVENEKEIDNPIVKEYIKILDKSCNFK